MKSNSLQKIVEKVYGAGGIVEISFMRLLHTFWYFPEALVEDFKKTWIRVDPNSSMPFIPYIYSTDWSLVGERQDFLM